jgi:hypothetical protein
MSVALYTIGIIMLKNITAGPQQLPRGIMELSDLVAPN